MTVDEIVVDMEKGRYNAGQAYVAFSRVKTYEKLHIIKYDRRKIIVAPAVHREMIRLRENRLPKLSKPMITDMDGAKISFGHLNVQGLGSRITGKYADILKEKDLQLLDVMCLTETHLESNNNLAVNDLWKNEKQGSLFQCNRSGKRGGGIALLITKNYIHRRINIDCSGLEMIIAAIDCPERVIFCGMYIPPKQKKQEVVAGMNRVLSNVDANEDQPIVIMGDLNEDLLNSKKHEVHDFLIGKGFTQHLSSPTTDHAALLDHIYTRNISKAIQSEVIDCYYSDHDKTFCLLSE